MLLCTNKMTNKEQREEEFLSLKSILNNDFLDLDEDHEQFEIVIDFHFSTKFLLHLNDHKNPLFTSIQYLPPLILTINYHEQYPSSNDPPTYVLTSDYLSSRYLETMCKKLDHIWEENVGQLIVYLWIEILREELLNLNELYLNDNEFDYEHDDQRIKSNLNRKQAAQIYEELIEYNSKKIYEQFLNEYHQCSICLTDKILGREMIQLNKCQHSFCRVCLHDYAQMHIKNGSVEWLICPHFECQTILFPWEIQMIINDNHLYDKYERLLLQKTLEQMEDIVWCPRCQNAVLTNLGTDNLALCDQCHFTFCKKCKKTYHSQTLCAHEFQLKDKHKKLRSRFQQLNLSNEEIERLLQDFLNIARIENSTRLCPNRTCQVPIEKNMGCDHMYCTRCRTHFNWSQAIDRKDENEILFDKFNGDLDRIQESLIRESRDNDDEQDLNPKKMTTISDLFIKRTKRCPNTKCNKMQVIGKSNYIICGYCKKGSCAVCGQLVFNPNRHFANACKRFST